jgi:transposase InsO family protein
LSGFDASSASVALNFAICRNDGLRQLPYPGKNLLDLSATPASIGGGRDAEVANQLAIAAPEGLRHFRRNLLGLQPQRFKVTTDSNHKFEVYLNVAARMRLSGINQLWVADITYIRLKAEFVYLAVILDGFSRRVVAGHWIELWRFD